MKVLRGTVCRARSIGFVEFVMIFLVSLLFAAISINAIVVRANPVAKDDCPGEKCTLRWYGNITRENVAEALNGDWLNGVRRLEIFSGGGEALAATKLGEEIHAREIDVVVDTWCHSSCANYIFTAGKRKTIPKGAIVSWHGGTESAETKRAIRYYEREEKVSRISGDSAKAEKFAIASRAYLEAAERQRALFEKLGVKEILTRLGEVQKSPGVKVWTIPRDEFEFYGISNVSAPEDYGSPDYHSRRTFNDATRPRTIRYADLPK